MEINPKVTTLAELQDKHFKKQKEEKEKTLLEKLIKVKKIKKIITDGSFIVLILLIIYLIYSTQTYKTEINHNLSQQRENLFKLQQMVSGVKDYENEVQTIADEISTLKIDVSTLKIDFKENQKPLIDPYMEMICKEEAKQLQMCNWYDPDTQDIRTKQCKENQYCITSLYEGKTLSKCQERRCIK